MTKLDAVPTMERDFIDGPCNGYAQGQLFRLENGHVWEQTAPYTERGVRYRPLARIQCSATDGLGLLRLEGTKIWVDVRRVK